MEVKVKVFESVGDMFGATIKSCVDGMHVTSEIFCGALSSRTVIECDGTCKNKRILHESDCAPDTRRELHEVLGKGEMLFAPQSRFLRG